MTIVLYVLFAYLAVCWLWGLYLAIRLYTGRRLTRLMQGQPARQRKLRPLTRDNAPSSKPATRRAADALAESQAA